MPSLKSREDNKILTEELFAALKNDDASEVARLAGLGASLINERGDPALVVAAAEGRVRSLHVLIALSDILGVGDDGAPALVWAARFNQVDAIKILAPLTPAGAKDTYGRTALMTAVAKAAFCGTAATLALLPFSDLNLLDEKGMTAEEMAKGKGTEAAAAAINSFVLAQGEQAALSRVARKLEGRGGEAGVAAPKNSV